jgi:citrate lyase subunit beta/citryl-CoA lyase
VVLPKAEGARSIAALAVQLAGTSLEGVPVLPIATETPFAMFQLGSYVGPPPPLPG